MSEFAAPESFGQGGVRFSRILFLQKFAPAFSEECGLFRIFFLKIRRNQNEAVVLLVETLPYRDCGFIFPRRIGIGVDVIHDLSGDGPEGIPLPGMS